MSDLEQFRQETRTWLDENCPQSMRVPVKDLLEGIYTGGREPEIDHPDQKLWCDRMASK
ncbi:MAG: acyl-CoA dehydrogenase, partial [Halioglobus sp.]